MINLPSAWRWATIDEIAGGTKSNVVIGPFGSSLKVSDYKDSGVPLVFVRNVRARDFGASGARFVSPAKALELQAHAVRPGDVLITKMGDPPGDAAVYPDLPPGVVTADCIRLRPGPTADAKFLAYAFEAPVVKQQFQEITRGVAQQKVSLARFRQGVVIPLPPLDEQRRIVNLLEGHLTRIHAASEYLRAGQRKLTALQKSVLLELLPDVVDYPASWRRATVQEAGKVELGRQRHPDWHHGSNMKPYLRVANVFEDRIDTSSLYEMHWPEDLFERFRLVPGDVLLNEGQTPELLGRPALYRGVPEDVAFTNSLIRFKANDDVLPEFALLVFRRHMHAGRFTRESRITTNIAHLSATRLKSIEFPIPTLAVQADLVATAEARLSAIAHLGAELSTAQLRLEGLRRALLGAAFAGRLTPSAQELEVVHV